MSLNPGLVPGLVPALRAIPPGEPEEDAVRAKALALATGPAGLIREDVDRPDPHLVSYALVTDGEQLLLVDHIKAGLWLPSGGHVDANESPRDTALREFSEELGYEGQLLCPDPIFVSLQRTNGPRPHHDLSLWYLMAGDPTRHYNWDRREFRAIRWFHPCDIPLARAEPHLPRVLKKLTRLGHLRAEVAT